MSEQKLGYLVNCEKCGSEIDSIRTYHYKWNEKTPINNPILYDKDKWTGEKIITLVDRRYTQHYGHVYRQEGMKFYVDYSMKFNGLLIDGDSKRQIYFNSIKCPSCFSNALKDKESLEYKLNERLAIIEKELYRHELQIIKEKDGPFIDSLGCITFGFNTIFGYNLKETEKKVKDIMENIVCCEFEPVYSYTEELNPDRDGIYVIVRPTKLLKTKLKNK